MKANFIVVEGMEGAGKSTAVAVIEQWLHKMGIQSIRCVREPGGTPTAEKLRQMIKTQDSEEPLTAVAELLLMVAARVQLIENVIKPALAQGCWVISDRHALSTWAYQGGGRQLPDEMIETFHRLALSDFKPDFTIYLDVAPTDGLRRISAHRILDRIEQENAAFFARVYAKYQDLVGLDPRVARVDGSQPIHQVHHDIQAVLAQYYPDL